MGVVSDADGGMGYSGEEYGQEFAAIVEIAEVFTELVATLTLSHTVGLNSEQVVHLAGHLLPRADHAGLLVLKHGQVHTLAANSPVLTRIDAIRAETQEGPGLDVLEVNDLAISGDLAADEQWPRFGPRVAAELGIRSIACYRLYLSRDHRAALLITSAWPHAFDDLTLAVGAIFAAYCSLCLFSEHVLGDQLSARRAAQVHREIGIAVGILTTRDDIPADTAYRQLRQASRRLRRSLHHVAGHVLQHHQLPDA